MPGPSSAGKQWNKHRPLLVLALGILWLTLVHPICFGFRDKVLQGSITTVSPDVRTTTQQKREPSSTDHRSVPLLTVNSFSQPMYQRNISRDGTPKQPMEPLWPPPYRLWNQSTQRLELPDDYNFPLNGRPSLSILQSIIDNDQFQNRSIPSSDACYYPNLSATRALARQVLRGTVNLSLPVLNVGMPKVGTTTLYSFFNCSGWNASHGQNGRNMIHLVDSGVLQPLAKSEEDGYYHYRQAYLQLDRNKEVCIFPQIQFLDELHRELPNATFLLIFRPVADWIYSARSWFHLVTRWETNCSLPGLLCSGSIIQDGGGSDNLGRRRSCTDTDLYHWWCSHVQHIRKFVEQYPSHQLVELDLYNNKETSRLLSRLFGINRTCWGHVNRGNQSNATS